MATIQNKSTVQNTQDFITIQDLFYLCLDKWHWFAISLALCLGVVTFYLLRTPSVYVRTASILIKDDSKGKSSSTDMESFSDLGLFTTNTNVYNEMGTLKSPDIMREVVSRLHLEMNYQTDGRFHKQTVYGNQLPVQVVIPNLSENESATFELHLAKDGAVELSSFTRNGTEIENDGFVKGNLNDSIQSPLGPIVVIPSAAYSDKTVSTIYVTRQSLSVYGNQLPVQVVIPNLSENESATFELHLAKDGAVELSSFTRNGTEIENDGFVKGNLNDSIQSPLGPIVVIPSAAYSDKTVSTIYVTRQSLSAASAGCSARLNISQNDEKSNIITLSFQDVSTQRAEDVLNTLISVYNENWVRDKNQIAVSTSMFINERLGVIEGELGNVDDDISSFKSEHLLPDVQAAANMYMTQANEANAAIRELNNQAYMARYIKNYLTNENNKHQLLPANSGIENASLATQLNEYNTKLLERNSLVSHSSAKNPLVREMDKSLDDMRSALITSIDNQMVALRAQIRSLEAIGGQATSQIASNPKQSKYLLSVERQQKVKESLYLYLLQKREENELSQAFTAYNTRIITKPGGSMIPTAPVKKNIFLVAFALGILIPVVIIFIRENMNTRVRGRKDLDGLSVPFIGEIPLSIRGKKRVKSYEAHTIVVKEGSRDIMNEAFRVLRTNLEFMIGKDQSSNVIVVTSFNPGSGKSFLTMNIAISLAIKNKKVLVIDGDLRHASASAYIHSPKIGLSNYLGGQIDKLSDIIVTNEQHPSFSFIPVGTIPPNPTELLFDDRLQKAIHTLKQQYDVVLIDCPPVELVADTQIIEKLADRTVFVVRAGLLERSMLPELENIYREKKYKNMSVILNGTEGSGGRYGYRYGYQYGYGSGSYYGNNDRSK